MSAAPVGRHVGYTTVRRTVVGLGLLALAGIAAILYATRVETVEVVAVLLYVPVFLAFVRWGAWGGLVAGLGAAAGYTALRYPSIDAIGGRSLATLLLSRLPGYVGFGVIGGWAATRLRGSLLKLDTYDEIDDATGLYNARFFVRDVDYEIGRARRYGTPLSIVEIDLALDHAPNGARHRVLHDLAGAAARAVRAPDRVVHATEPGRHRFAVLLPDTGAAGARVVTGRFTAALAEQLRAAGMPDGTLSVRRFSFPEEVDAIVALAGEFARTDAVEHPGAPSVPLGQPGRPSPPPPSGPPAPPAPPGEPA